MTPPIHSGMPCDPLDVTTDEEPWTCPACSKLVPGYRVTHHRDSSHTWTPEDRSYRAAGCALMALSALVVLLVIGVVAWLGWGR